MDSHLINIVVYIIIGIVVFVVRANKTKRLNEQKRLERIAAAKRAEQQKKEQQYEDIKERNEPIIIQQELTEDAIDEIKNIVKNSKQRVIIEDDMHRDIVDYDKIAADPNIDLIPDEPVHIEHKEEKTFFEKNFNEKFDLRKAIIYSEIMNRKY